MKPKDLVLKWVDAFNKQDFNTIIDLYHDDATNHQVAKHPVVGISSIKEMFRVQFLGRKKVCLIENLFQDGEWAILEWKDSRGLRGCGFFHVVNGKIKLQRGYWDKLSSMNLNNK